MKVSLRTGILIILLVVPVLVFLFLKFFGQNHYTLRTFFPLDVESVQVNGKMVSDTVYHKIPDFKFVSQNGDTITQETFKGKIYVADFIFTRCLGICPKLTNQMLRVQDAFKGNPVLKIISHTVDPEYDSVAVLNHYAASHHADSTMWYFVTGKKQELFDLAQKGYFITALGAAKPEDINHSEKFVLVDKEGHIRGYYDGTNPEEVDRLILEINILLYEYKNQQPTALKQ